MKTETKNDPSKIEISDMLLQQASDHACDKIRETADTLLRYSRELKRRIEQIENHGGELQCHRADIISWAVNDAENCVRNMNLSTLVVAASRMAVAEEQLRVRIAEATSR